MRKTATPLLGWFAIALAILIGTWSTTYMRGHAAAAAQKPAGSTAAPNLTGELAEMGGTYYWLDGRSRSVTTRFRDGAATAERKPDGNIGVRVADRAGNDVATVTVHRASLRQNRIELSRGGSTVTVMARPDVVPTLEWANLQARALLNDEVAAVTPVETRGRFVRARGAAADDIEASPIEIAVEFDGGISATTTRNDRDVKVGSALRRPTFITRVQADAAEVGVIRWYEREQILAFNFPGLTGDVFTPDTLKKIGGWTFKPTMAWGNVQGLAFYDFHRRVKLQGQVARTPRTRNRLQAIAEVLMPTAHANDLGCDMLHWLDTSVFRPCCDQHDTCYGQDSQRCSSNSWFWPFASNWQCESCNIAAAWCFAGVGATCVNIPGACIEFQY